MDELDVNMLVRNALAVLTGYTAAFTLWQYIRWVFNGRT